MNMENARAPIRICWDVESCPIPANFDGLYYIAKNIRLALSNANFHGTPSIFPYGDTDFIPSDVRTALYRTGISLYHVPTGGAYKQIAMEMIVWMSDNPAPATFLLISGNDSFSSLLHDLSVRSHSILLCGPSQLDESLTANANFIWHWPTLISQGRPLDQMTYMENAYTNISVWWDVESCPIPTNFDGIDYIAKNIRIALSNANFHGKLSISAYGNTDLIPDEVQNALHRTGISLHHVSTGGLYREVMFAMLTWIRVNPVPANILLISGDDSFSELLHDPYVRRYTILLSGTSQLDASLTSAANVIWLWPTLISGGRPLNTSEQFPSSSSREQQGGESGI